ncbi:MAG TPA: helix-turn-helix domain-containing protein [Solirubrobacteraceae bacterium]
MTARADAARATAERILDAAADLFFADPSEESSLDAIAARAGVSKQTVLRHFGTKDDVLAAATDRAVARFVAERDAVTRGDVAGAVAAVVAHYERVGDGVLRMLAEEHRSPLLRERAALGRELHERWCRRVFAPRTPRRLAQVIAVTDVYTWKLLRRDRGLSRAQTELAMRELIEGVTP